MAALLVAALVWVCVHIGVAGTRLRGVIVGRLGEAGFQVGFSLVSVASIAALVVAWQGAPYVGLWTAPDWLRWVLVVVMLPACVLLVGAFSVRNPTSAGQGAAMAAEPRGVVRITRHPMLWAFAIWGGAHVLGNGDVAALLFFGAFLVTALAGMPSIDAKLARRDPAGFAALAGRTSVVPFAAGGRLRDVGIVAAVGGAVLWGVLLWLHPVAFGVQPWPG